MAHPYAAHRQTKKEHSRVSHIAKGYKSGGAVKHPDAAEDCKLIKSMVKKSDLKAEGGKVKHRMDRPKKKRADGGRIQPITPQVSDNFQRAIRNAGSDEESSRISNVAKKRYGVEVPTRAKGGRVKGNRAKTIVNVITGHPGGGAAPPPMPGGIAPAAMPPVGGPPMMAKPPMPGPGGPPMPPPGAPPMRARGGRVGQTPTGSGVASNTKDAERNKGSKVFNQSMRNGTQISHTDGKSDGKDIGRGKAVSFRSGGKVKSFYAKGGRVESPDGVAPATRLPGGGGGGEARLAKAHREARKG